MSKTQRTKQTAYSAPIVQKTLKLVTRIATDPEAYGVSRLASDLSMAKSTTHGILAALEKAGWVVRDPTTRRYTCGHALKEIAASARVRIPLVGTARPFLEDLAAGLDEDVFLGMLTPHHILILDQVESSKELKVATRPGTRLSLFAGASGKIFHAFQDRELVSALLRSRELPRFTARSITDPETYLAELDSVRESGFAVDVEEYIPDVRAVAVPIFLGRGNRRRVVAGVWVVGLGSSMSDDKMRRAADLALNTGASISLAISGGREQGAEPRAVG
jgi:DNA-binding IclR family transcriptional regulator